MAQYDATLADELQAILPLIETDMTLFYRTLANVDAEAAGDADDATLIAPLTTSYYDPSQLTDDYRQRLVAWLRAYCAQVPPERAATMNAANPKYVLRNFMAQLVIDRAEESDFSPVSELLDVLRHPYDEQPESEEYAQKRPEWARHRAGCSMLSCSS